VGNGLGISHDSRALAAGRLGASVGITDSLLQQALIVQNITIDDHPRNVVVVRGGILGSASDHIEVIVDTRADLGPRHSAVGHGASVAALALGRVTIGLLHAEDERPSLHGLRPHSIGVRVGQQILGAQLLGISLTLTSAVLARVGTIGVLLGIAVSNQL